MHETLERIKKITYYLERSDLIDSHVFAHTNVNLFFQSLGQVGRVSQVFPTGDVRVGVNGMNWTFNPACLTLAPGENPPEVPG